MHENMFFFPLLMSSTNLTLKNNKSLKKSTLRLLRFNTKEGKSIMQFCKSKTIKNFITTSYRDFSNCKYIL
jgi:hypothetical protein